MPRERRAAGATRSAARTASVCLDAFRIHYMLVRKMSGRAPISVPFAPSAASAFASLALARAVGLRPLYWPSDLRRWTAESPAGIVDSVSSGEVTLPLANRRNRLPQRGGSGMARYQHATPTA